MATSTIWAWSLKEEPASPLHLSEQEWYNASDNVALEVEVDEAKQSRAEAASKLLKDLDQWLHEGDDEFPQSFEEVEDIPLYDELIPPSELTDIQDVTISPQPSLAPHHPLTTDSVPFSNFGVDSLSPHSVMKNSKNIPLKKTSSTGLMKQSTKLHSSLRILTEEPDQSTHFVDHSPSQFVSPEPAVVPVFTSFMSDITNLTSLHTLTPPESPGDQGSDVELQEVPMLQEMGQVDWEELVNMAAVELFDSPESSCSSNSSIQEDKEYVATSPSSTSSLSDPECTTVSPQTGKARKRRRVAKPYSRPPPEEKRQRKKEQNKSAATRYRLKKKQEFEEILNEERELEQRNEDLKKSLSKVQDEIKVVKGLLREMFKH